MVSWYHSHMATWSHGQTTKPGLESVNFRSETWNLQHFSSRIRWRTSRGSPRRFFWPKDHGNPTEQSRIRNTVKTAAGVKTKGCQKCNSRPLPNSFFSGQWQLKIIFDQSTLIRQKNSAIWQVGNHDKRYRAWIEIIKPKIIATFDFMMHTIYYRFSI